MLRLSTSTGCSANSWGCCSYAWLKCSIDGRTQWLPFSTGRILMVGNRVGRPWPTMAAMVSSIARWPMVLSAANPDPSLNGSISPPGMPSHSLM